MLPRGRAEVLNSVHRGLEVDVLQCPGDTVPGLQGQVPGTGEPESIIFGCFCYLGIYCKKLGDNMMTACLNYFKFIFLCAKYMISIYRGVLCIGSYISMDVQHL